MYGTLNSGGEQVLLEAVSERDRSGSEFLGFRVDSAD